MCCNLSLPGSKLARLGRKFFLSCLALFFLPCWLSAQSIDTSVPPIKPGQVLTQTQYDELIKRWTAKDNLLTEAQKQRDDYKTLYETLLTKWDNFETTAQPLISGVQTSISESKTLGTQIGAFLAWATEQDQAQKKTISDLETENTIHWIGDAVLLGFGIWGWAHK